VRKPTGVLTAHDAFAKSRTVGTKRPVKATG